MLCRVRQRSFDRSVNALKVVKVSRAKISVEMELRK